MRQQITRAVNANNTARRAMKRMIDLLEEHHIYGAAALLVAKATGALGENLEAIREIELIVKNSKE